jgi:hypothetical protein
MCRGKGFEMIAIELAASTHEMADEFDSAMEGGRI